MSIIKRQTNETLRSDMWRACDILRRDNNVGGVVQYTEHLAWLLFLKFLDEEEQERVAQASLGDGEHYEPVLQGDLAWDAWAAPKRILMANTSGQSNRQDVGACAGLCAPWASWRILGASAIQLW